MHDTSWSPPNPPITGFFDLLPGGGEERRGSTAGQAWEARIRPRRQAEQKAAEHAARSATTEVEVGPGQPSSSPSAGERHASRRLAR
jgi:hypothetical protein